jgi:hypothetical protein
LEDIIIFYLPLTLIIDFYICYFWLKKEARDVTNRSSSKEDKMLVRCVGLLLPDGETGVTPMEYDASVWKEAPKSW